MLSNTRQQHTSFDRPIRPVRFGATPIDALDHPIIRALPDAAVRCIEAEGVRRDLNPLGVQQDAMLLCRRLQEAILKTLKPAGANQADAGAIFIREDT